MFLDAKSLASVTWSPVLPAGATDKICPFTVTCDLSGTLSVQEEAQSSFARPSTDITEGPDQSRLSLLCQCRQNAMYLPRGRGLSILLPLVPKEHVVPELVTPVLPKPAAMSVALREHGDPAWAPWSWGSGPRCHGSRSCVTAWLPLGLRSVPRGVVSAPML